MLAWIGLTVWALWRKPRRGSAFWMLLAVGAMSMMYYFPWVGLGGGIWWLLLGMRLKQVGALAHKREHRGAVVN